MVMNKKKLIDVLPLILICLIYLISITHSINLVTADLGRHLKNGQVFLESFSIPLTNYYSYTQPSYHFINHHWGSGVIFYLVYKISGFIGLSLFFNLISVATFLIFYKIAKNHGFQNIALITSLLLLPLLCERTEIRPEAFSYLLAGLFYYWLTKFKENKLSFCWLLLLPVLQILWVNLHIYFFMGLMLIGLFWLQSLTNHRQQSKQFSNITIVLILSILAVFINPFGLQGVITPLTIFKSYGYRVLENQPVWFIEKIIPSSNYLIFKIIFVLLIVSFIIFFLKKKSLSLVNFIIAIFFSLMAWLSIRNFTIFALFSLPTITGNLSQVIKIKNHFLQKITGYLTYGLVILIFLLVISGNLKLSPRPFPFGLGLEENNSLSADFFKKEKLTGPVFNNYDIGGYLIWHLFPKERVFVDNRPEAYNEDFFKKVYVPMQENEKVWQEVNKKYNFNVIFFYRHDATPWGQQFLVSRIKDKEWVPVFVDNYTIIFVKNKKLNQAVIKNFQIPPAFFSVRGN